MRAELGDGAAAAGGGRGELAAAAELPEPHPGRVPVSSAWPGLPGAAGPAARLSACFSESYSVAVSGEALVAGRWQGCGRGSWLVLGWSEQRSHQLIADGLRWAGVQLPGRRLQLPPKQRLVFHRCGV